MFMLVSSYPYTQKIDKEIDYKLGLVLINYNHTGMSTGFFVDDSGLILTVAHGIPKGGFEAFMMVYPVYVKPFDTGVVYKASIVGISRSYDILLLKIEGYEVKACFNKFIQPIENMEVEMVGYPSIEWFVRKEGKIIINHIHGFVGIDEYSSPGASGSPVFNKDGYVVGMINKLDDRAKFTIIVPGNSLYVFLKNYQRLLKAAKLQMLLQKEIK